jgi:hypothetical protein
MTDYGIRFIVTDGSVGLPLLYLTYLYLPKYFFTEDSYSYYSLTTLHVTSEFEIVY